MVSTDTNKRRKKTALIGAAALVCALFTALTANPASATTVTTGYNTATSTGTIGPAAPGDPITTAQMILRADDWISADVPYNEGAGWEDSGTGGPYREDCSGFVSMAWGLTSSLVTWTLPLAQYSTITDSNISGDLNLNPGDALDLPGAPNVEPAHVVLFDSWISKSAGTFFYDAEHTKGQVTNRTEGYIYSSSLEGYAIGDFEALRYNDIAPPAPGSLSPLAESGNGQDVVFVNPSGQVVNDWYTGSAWSGPVAIGGTARADSPVVENEAGTQVVFFNTSGQVVNDWYANGAWNGPEPIGGSAEAGSGLAESSDGTDVAFLNGSGAVVNDFNTNSTWGGPSPLGGTARTGSPLVEDANGQGVVFFNTSGQVVNDWYANSVWNGPVPIGGSAEAGSGLAASSDGTDVAFLNTSGAVVNDFNTNSTWGGPSPLGGTARTDSPLVEDANGQGVVFFNTNGQVVNDYYTGTTWNGPEPIGGSAETDSGLAASSDGTDVAFLNTSGAVVNDFNTNSTWGGPSPLGGTSE